MVCVLAIKINHMTLIWKTTDNPGTSTQSKLTLERLALDQVQVVGLLQDAALEATAKSFQISTVNIEHITRHDGCIRCLTLNYPLQGNEERLDGLAGSRRSRLIRILDVFCTNPENMTSQNSCFRETALLVIT